MKNNTPDWIAVDWGTSNIRVWAMDDDGYVLDSAISDRGMATLKPEAFEPALLALIGSWLPDNRVVNVIACGMVGARQGWVEAPYGVVPCNPLQAESILNFIPRDPRFRMHIIAGLQQNAPADVMRGEETQIAGLLAVDRDFSGVVCLPGTHTKWVSVADQKITGFTTQLTGEIFSLLADKSVLRHTIAADGWDEAEFSITLGIAFDEPSKVIAHLFSVRAEALIGDLGPTAARARLSALLLGLELNAVRDLYKGRKVSIIGSDTLAKTYERALLLDNTQVVVLDGEGLTLSGLRKAYTEIIAEGQNHGS